MTGRDRIVVIGLLALAVLAGGVAAGRLARAQEGRPSSPRRWRRAGPARERRRPARQRAPRTGEVRRRLRLDREPRQSRPADQEVPSLIYQLAQASNQKSVEFTSITSAGAGASPRRRLRGPRERSTAAAARLHADAVHVRVQRQLFEPRTACFRQLDGFALRTTSGALQVSGRLLTIQSVKLAPATSRARGSGKPCRQRAHRHDHRDRLRAAAPARASTGGATPAGPAGTGAAAGSPREPRAPPTPRPWSQGEPMNDFLQLAQGDLLDSRLLPVVALLGVALARRARLRRARRRGLLDARRRPRASRALRRERSDGAVTISQAPAEPQRRSPRRPAAPPSSTTGARATRSRRCRKPKQGHAPASARAPARSSSSTSSSGVGHGSTASSGADDSQRPRRGRPSRPSGEAEGLQSYHVTVLFGEVPAPVPDAPAPAQLKPYNLQLLNAAALQGDPLLVFRGRRAAQRQDATFTLTGEAILHGSGTCLPSAYAVPGDRAASRAERAARSTSADRPGHRRYELRLVSISQSVSLRVHRARATLGHRSKAGRELLRRAGLIALPGLRYSPRRACSSLRSGARRSPRRAHARRGAATGAKPQQIS